MKTLIFVLLGGAFLVAVVQTQNDQITDTKKHYCPVNEIYTNCEPCERFCNEAPRPCLKICILGNFCTCVNGYSRISRTNKICIPNEWCYLFAKQNCTATTTTTEPATISTTEPPK